MSSHLRICACALIATGALALPAGADAAGIQTAARAVQAHTDRADAALDRAVSLFGQNSDRAARKAFATSRKEMELAKAAAAKARRQAATPSENAQAVRAQELVGAELGENIEKLAAALLPADGADENKIAAAAGADAQARERAIAIMTALMGQVPDQARFGVAQAIAALSQDRDDESRAAGEALVSKHVSSANKRRVAEAVKVGVKGQATASATLAALMADPNMPLQSKQVLHIAYDAMIGEHDSVADILSRLSSRTPASVRAFVGQIITQARTDAQGMRANHPTGLPASPSGAGIPGCPFAGA